MVTIKTLTILFFISMLVLISCETNNTDNVPENLRCESSIDCIPASCCHPDSCVNIDSKPDCKEIMCSMECVPGTMDCGQGSCTCENSQCTAKITKMME